MTRKTAKAQVGPVRQRTQFSCMSTSMMMCLQANGMECDEDEVNKVMGARPMRGAAWEDALACAQHYGMRAHLTVPATIRQLKDWTDREVPVMIAWNPEGRDWSHASVVYDVTEGLPADIPETCSVEGSGPGLYVWVADPNIPHPDKTTRVVHEDDFYKRWFEKWPNYLVRRPACAIEREIDASGRQVMASARTQQGSNTMSKKNACGPGGCTCGGSCGCGGGQKPDIDIVDVEIDRLDIEDFEAALVPKHADDVEAAMDKVVTMSVHEYADMLELDEEGETRLAKFPEGKEMSVQDMVDYFEEAGNQEAADEWRAMHEKYQDKIKEKAEKTAKFPEGKSMSIDEMVAYFEEAGNQEAADEWRAMHDKYKDQIKKQASEKTAKFPKGKKMTIDEMAAYFENAGNQEAADEWRAMHDKYKDQIKKKQATDLSDVSEVSGAPDHDRASVALLEFMKGLNPGDTVSVVDIEGHPIFKHTDFSRVPDAAEAMADLGMLHYEGGVLTKKAALDKVAGFFSWECLGCGYSILSDRAINPDNDFGWMTKAVIVDPDGSIFKGEYDGYGRLDTRLGTVDISDLGFPSSSMWHEACWEKAGKPGFTKPSPPADDQGWFFDDEEYQGAKPGVRRRRRASKQAAAGSFVEILRVKQPDWAKFVGMLDKETGLDVDWSGSTGEFGSSDLRAEMDDRGDYVDVTLYFDGPDHEEDAMEFVDQMVNRLPGMMSKAFRRAHLDKLASGTRRRMTWRALPKQAAEVEISEEDMAKLHEDGEVEVGEHTVTFEKSSFWTPPPKNAADAVSDWLAYDLDDLDDEGETAS